MKKGGKKASSNYALEQAFKATSIEQDNPHMWLEIAEGFISPEAALVYVSQKKLEGKFRAIRVASEEVTAGFTTPDPVFEIKKKNGKALKVQTVSAKPVKPKAKTVKTPKTAKKVAAETPPPAETDGDGIDGAMGVAGDDTGVSS